MVSELTFWPIIAVILFAMWTVSPLYGALAIAAGIAVLVAGRKDKQS